MSRSELKQRLFKQIELTENDEILEEVYRILELGSYNEAENLISNELMASIEKGLDDYKNGRIVSNEQAKLVFEKWLNK